MSDEQKAAAKVMGFTKASWDDDDGKKSSGAKYENYDWKEVRLEKAQSVRCK